MHTINAEQKMKNQLNNLINDPQKLEELKNLK
jgi:hypothetical protein